MDVRPVAAFVPWACNLPQLNIKAYALTIVQRNLSNLPINRICFCQIENPHIQVQIQGNGRNEGQGNGEVRKAMIPPSRTFPNQVHVPLPRLVSAVGE